MKVPSTALSLYLKAREVQSLILNYLDILFDLLGFLIVFTFAGVDLLKVSLAKRDKSTKIKQAKIRSAITKKSLVRLIDCEGICSVVAPGDGSEITAGALNKNVKLLVIGDSPTAIIV